MVESDEVEERLLSLLREVAARFAGAKVERITDRGPVILKLSCTTEGTASISMIPDPGQVDVFMGQAIHLEFLDSTLDDLINDIRTLVEGVVTGSFEETVWEGFGKILRSRGVIHSPDGRREPTGSGGDLRGFLWPWPKRLIKYRPYT